MNKDVIPEPTSQPGEALYISHEETTHFDRDGFSGDIFIPKEAEFGFNALEVIVTGRYPRKRILPGTTRSYYVLDGEGTFTLNDTIREVSKGDLLVIPAHNEYEYEGNMKLFEFNVSPGNSFRDKVIESEAGETTETHYRPFSKPDREGFARAIGTILSHGFTLTYDDIRAILPSYGYSGGSPGQHMYRSLFIIREAGVNIGEETYNRITIFRDKSLDVMDTDLAATKVKIDSRKQGMF